MDKKQDNYEIDLLELWDVFVEHIIPIILAAVLCVAALYAYSSFLLKPMYESTATLYILKQDNGEYTSSDYTLALNVVNDCTYMITSDAVLNTVISDLNLNMSSKSLAKLITTNNPSNTRVIEITVRTDSAVESKRIVDSVCDVAADKISASIGMDSVNVYSKADLQREPCNTFGTKMYALGAVVAAILMYCIYVIKFLINDSIKSPEDVEKYLGLVVLGDIPNCNAVKRSHGRYGKYQAEEKNGKISEKVRKIGGKSK